jgi:hypothetical protein
MINDLEIKLECTIIGCKHNQWYKTNYEHCNLKSIKLGIGTVKDYDHGIAGMCLQMEYDR